jgi:hypothetical protein
MLGWKAVKRKFILYDLTSPLPFVEKIDPVCLALDDQSVFFPLIFIIIIIFRFFFILLCTLAKNTTFTQKFYS